ncbi:MAG: divalent-cation tolerance protein CutA [Candidatus Gastranaerophilaceae bacterium]
MDIILVYCTVPDKKTAKEISTIIVKNKLAACVSITDRVESFFSWDGEFCKEKEVLLTIKTIRDNFEEISNLINELHPYNVPEVIAVPVINCSEEYMRWIVHETR